MTRKLENVGIGTALRLVGMPDGSSSSTRIPFLFLAAFLPRSCRKWRGAAEKLQTRTQVPIITAIGARAYRDAVLAVLVSCFSF